jgi:hypothetical protein
VDNKNAKSTKSAKNTKTAPASKLSLKKESLRKLTPEELAAAAGGAYTSRNWTTCCIMTYSYCCY